MGILILVLLILIIVNFTLIINNNNKAEYLKDYYKAAYFSVLGVEESLLEYSALQEEFLKDESLLKQRLNGDFDSESSLISIQMRSTWNLMVIDREFNDQFYEPAHTTVLKSINNLNSAEDETEFRETLDELNDAIQQFSKVEEKASQNYMDKLGNDS